VKKKIILFALMAAMVGGTVKFLKGKMGGKTVEEE
jgi:hypothetical protein